MLLVPALVANQIDRFIQSLPVHTEMSDKEKHENEEVDIPEEHLLQEFNLAFNERGELRQTDPETLELSDRPFEYNVHPTRDRNQKRYEEIGRVINSVVYQRLQKDCGLYRVYFPEHTCPPRAFFFATRDYLRAEKLIIFINGNGVVKAGQWSRKLIINNSLDAGTQFPYIKECIRLGYGIVVLNTNCNYFRDWPLHGSSDPVMHAKTVWEQFVSKGKARSIGIIAHSYGGFVALHLAHAFFEAFTERVFCVLLTDSIHVPLLISDFDDSTREEALKQFNFIGVNFVASSAAVGSTLRRGSEMAMNLRSAGTTEHEWTSHVAFEAVIRELNVRWDRRRAEMDMQGLSIN